MGDLVSRYHVYTNAEHPDLTSAAGHTLTFYTDSGMGTLATLYADEVGAATLDNPYTVPVGAVVDFWTEDPSLWVKASGETTASPLYINLSQSSGGGYATRVTDYGAAGDGTTDDSAAIQAAIDSCGIAGGVVFFPPGTYFIDADPILLPHSLTGTLVLSGYAATIKLGTNLNTSSIVTGDPYVFGVNPPRFGLFCDKSASHQWFQHYVIEGLTFDCNDLAAVPLAFSTYADNHYKNFDDITVRDVRVVNLSEVEDATWPCGLQMNTNQGVFTTRNYITNILIENFTCLGGSCGIQITSQSTAAGNTFMDRITLRNCYHDTLCTTHAGQAASNNFHIGSYGYGGNLLVENCIGIGSGENGLETNSFDHITVRDCVMKNYANTGYIYTNFHAPLHGKGECLYSGCQAEQLGAFGAEQPSESASGFHMGVASHVTYRDCRFLCDATASQDTMWYPVMRLLKGHFDSVVIDGLTVEMNFGTMPASSDYTLIALQPGGPTNVKIRNVDVSLTGARAVADGFIRVFNLAGHDVFYDIDGVTVDHKVTGCADAGSFEVFSSRTLDEWDTTMLGATVSNVRARTPITDPKYPAVFGIVDAVLSGPFLVHDCDLTGFVENDGLMNFAPSFTERRRISSVIYPTKLVQTTIAVKPTLTIDSVSTHAALPEVVTASAHGMVVGDWCCIQEITELPAAYYQVVSTDAATHFTVSGTTTGTDTGFCQPAYTNRDGYDEDLIVVGGTVTSIQISIDGGENFFPTGLLEGVFRLKEGDIILIYNSSAPTLRKLPRP